MPDERFRIIFEGKERNLDQVLKKIEKAPDQISGANPFEKINDQMALMGKSMDQVVGVVVLPAASSCVEILAIDQGACRAISEKK